MLTNPLGCLRVGGGIGYFDATNVHHHTVLEPTKLVRILLHSLKNLPLFFYHTPSCQHHKLIFLRRCLHDATQRGKAEDRSRVHTSGWGVVVCWWSHNGYQNVLIIIGGMARVTRCYLWQLGFRVITLGSLGFTPRVPKRTVEDKLDRYSDKTFHCTTSAAYANDFLG